MQGPADPVPSWAAEFPNDNPALHEGVSWVCLSVCGPVKPILRPRASAARVLSSVASLSSATRAPAISPARVEAPAEAPPVAAAPEASVVAPEIPESVLDVLLERLDLDLTPSISSRRIDDVLDIDASDLGDLCGSPGPARDVAEPERIAAEPVSEVLLATAAVETTELVAPPAETKESALPPPVETTEAAALPVIETIEAAPPIETIEAAPPIETIEAAPPIEAAEARVMEPMPAVTLAEPATLVLVPSEAGAAPPPAPEPASDDYVAFVEALVAVLLGSGATRAGAVLPDLLDSGRIEAALLDAETIRGLSAAKIADEANGTVALRDEFIITQRAWRDVLRGTTNDLGACGTSTLDGWASDLLRALGVGREGRVDVRRELRRKGVAAFGMLRAA